MKLVLGRQNPTFSVTATQLRADITYSKATVSVVIDERGLNKYARDYVNEVDQLTVAFGKGLITTQQVTDYASFLLGKAITDITPPEDYVSLSVGFIRAFAATVTTGDQLLGLSVTKELFDYVAALENVVGMNVGALYEDFQPIYDNADANSGDGLEYTDVKPASDPISTADIATNSFGKLLEEAVSGLDAMSFDVTKPLTTDVALQDEASSSVDKPLVDSTNAEEVVAYVFDAVRAFSDSTLTADQLASIGVEKLLTDVYSAVSSGSLRMTDYVDITYLAEDYVGTSKTFS